MSIIQDKPAPILRIPVAAIAPETRSDLQQPRLLPLPEELLADAATSEPRYAQLMADLQELGRSLKERQLQPIVVYPTETSDPSEPHYVILVGHRRWTAARLAGLDTLDAVVVPPPDAAERVRLQYVENEDREEFNDIERLRAIQQLRRGLGDADDAWQRVEEQLHLSAARIKQLRRLEAFTPPQLKQLAILGLQETQLRPLHEALRGEKLDGEDADKIIAQLESISRERFNEAMGTAAHGGAEARGGIDVTSSRVRVDGPTVARLVAKRLREKAEVGRRPRWLDPFQKSVGGTRQAIQRVQRRAGSFDQATASLVLTELDYLMEQVQAARSVVLRQQQALVEPSADIAVVDEEL